MMVFESIDQNFAFQCLLFFAFFLIIYLPLVKRTKNSGISGAIGISGSLIIVCFFFARVNIEFRNFSSNSMLNEQIVYFFIPISILLTIIFLFRKFGIKNTLLILACAFMLAGAIISFTDLIFWKGTFFVGVFLMVVSFMVTKKEKSES